jgi:hypothetical protein
VAVGGPRRPQWRRGGSKLSRGGSLDEWSQIHMTLSRKGPDPLQNEKSIPDPHHSEKRDPDPRQSDADPRHCHQISLCRRKLRLNPGLLNCLHREGFNHFAKCYTLSLLNLIFLPHYSEGLIFSHFDYLINPYYSFNVSFFLKQNLRESC